MSRLRLFLGNNGRPGCSFPVGGKTRVCTCLVLLIRDSLLSTRREESRSLFLSRTLLTSRRVHTVIGEKSQVEKAREAPGDFEKCIFHFYIDSSNIRGKFGSRLLWVKRTVQSFSETRRNSGKNLALRRVSFRSVSSSFSRGARDIASRDFRRNSRLTSILSTLLLSSSSAQLNIHKTKHGECA